MQWYIIYCILFPGHKLPETPFQERITTELDATPSYTLDNDSTQTIFTKLETDLSLWEVLDAFLRDYQDVTFLVELALNVEFRALDIVVQLQVSSKPLTIYRSGRISSWPRTHSFSRLSLSRTTPDYSVVRTLDAESGLKVNHGLDKNSMLDYMTHFYFEERQVPDDMLSDSVLFKSTFEISSILHQDLNNMQIAAPVVVTDAILKFFAFTSRLPSRESDTELFQSITKGTTTISARSILDAVRGSTKSKFAERLFNDLNGQRIDEVDVSAICGCLPELLEEFALRLGQRHEKPDVMEAANFTHTHRR